MHFEDSLFTSKIEKQPDKTETPTLPQHRVTDNNDRSRVNTNFFGKKYAKIKLVMENARLSYLESSFSNGVPVIHIKEAHKAFVRNTIITSSILLCLLLTAWYTWDIHHWTLLSTVASFIILFILFHKSNQSVTLSALYLNLRYGKSMSSSIEFLELLRLRESPVIKEAEKTIAFLRELENSSLFFQLTSKCSPTSMEYKLVEEKILAKNLRQFIVQQLTNYVRQFIKGFEILESQEAATYREQLDSNAKKQIEDSENSKITLGVLNDYLYVAQAAELDFCAALRLKLINQKVKYPQLVEIIESCLSIKNRSQELTEEIRKEFLAKKSTEFLKPAEVEEALFTGLDVSPEWDRSEKALRALKMFIHLVKDDQKKFKRHLEFLSRIIASGFYTSEEKCGQALDTILFLENFYKELMASNLKNFGSLSQLFRSITDSKNDVTVLGEETYEMNFERKEQVRVVAQTADDERKINGKDAEISSDKKEESDDEIEIPRTKAEHEASSRKNRQMNAAMSEIESSLLRKGEVEQVIVSKKSATSVEEAKSQ